MNSIYYFDIDDELFKEIKGNINIGINDILDGMSEKNVSEGEMSLSVKIVLLPELVTDVNGKQKRILIPHIEHKTSTKMTVKKSSKGKIFNEEYAEDGYLALEKIGDKYAAVAVSEDASQMRIDDQRLAAALASLESDEDKPNA